VVKFELLYPIFPTFPTNPIELSARISDVSDLAGRRVSEMMFA